MMPLLAARLVSASADPPVQSAAAGAHQRRPAVRSFGDELDQTAGLRLLVGAEAVQD